MLKTSRSNHTIKDAAVKNIFRVFGCLVALSGVPAFGKVTLSGAILSNTTIGAADTTYVISGTVSLAQGVTLTVLPGTTLEFSSSSELAIGGTLIANGTASKPIIFTGSAPGSWRAVRFVNSVGSSIGYSVFENANVAIDFEGISVVPVRNSLFLNNRYAVWDSGGYQAFVFEDNSFVGNGDVFYGIRASGQSYFRRNFFRSNLSVFSFGYYFDTTEISGNSFVGNGFVFKAPAVGFGYGTVSIQGNWWNTTDPGVIGLLITDRQDDGLLQPANFSPFLTSAPSSVGGQLSNLVSAPVFVLQPSAASVAAGGSVTFSVSVSGTAPLDYQWRKDGGAIFGATNSTFSLSGVRLADAGSYSVAVSNLVGAVSSREAILTVTIPNPGRLINLSVLTDIATASDDFTLGYVVGGGGTAGAKPLVIRAAGPSLAAFGVPGTLDDPKFELFAGTTKTGENDNWGGSAQLSSSLSAVGAFAFNAPTSRDAALTASITTRDNSVKVSAVGSGTGRVIAEIYDATPAASFTTSTPRLINVSVRKHLGSGLTLGFVVGGATSAKILVRAIGPTLGGFGVSGVVADPQLALFNASSVKIGESNDWLGTAELTAAFAAVGAFALPATSKDAALLVTLAPGNYSAQVSGVNSTTGVALVEVYEVP